MGPHVAAQRPSDVRGLVDPDRRDRAGQWPRTQVPMEYPKMMYEAFYGPTHVLNGGHYLQLDRSAARLAARVRAVVNPW